MKKIFIRSPYFIQINETGQLGSKVELYLYNKGESVPTLPTYILSKKIASTTQTENTYNIANYAKELNNYAYLNKGSKLYIDDFNHAIDAIRYNVTFHLDNPNKGSYYVY